METQSQADPRFNKRVPCSVKVDGSSHSGMVLNVSRGGLFVQTGVDREPGDELSVRLSLGDETAEIPILARVVWRRVVPARLRTISRGGFGMSIQSAPESYYQFLAQVAGESQPPERKGVYRVRVRRSGEPRSRTLILRCASEAEARSRALSLAGAGWMILDLARHD